MNFFLKILCFNLILKLCLSKSKCMPKSKLDLNGTNILSSDEFTATQNMFNKYEKYVVYIWSQDADVEDWTFWVGVIIKDNIILGFYMDNGDGMHHAIGFKKLSKFNDGSTINIKKVINMRERMEELPQLSLILLETKLTLMENVSILPLPSKRHHKDNICITLSWGRYNQYSELTANKIIIRGECGDGVICFNRYLINRQMGHCLAYTGGEPIFCSGNLIGIVSYKNNCDDHDFAKATSVYDHLEWIKAEIEKLNSNLLTTKSGCDGTVLHTNLYIFFLYFFIYFFLYDTSL